MDLMQSLIASKLLGGGGGSEPILKTKSIYENGTYSATEDEADGYSNVTVDVPSDPDPSIYMYYWDLTKSLTDLIHGAQATLSTSGADFIEDTGIIISSTGYVKTAVTAINFWGKTIEYHIKNMSKNFGDTCRLLTLLNNQSGGFIFRTDHWQINDGSNWKNYIQSSSNEILEDGVLKLVFDSDRNNVNIYINDTKIYEGDGFHSTIGQKSTEFPSVGSVKVKNNYYTSYNMTVTSIRVYENGSGGKGTTELNVTQNGTYTAPTGTAYSEVNVDVSQTPHLNTRTIKNNGKFISAVDGYDGYDSVIIDVDNGAPNYEQLTVTQNGVYVPPSSSVITFGPADGIPENTETQVYTGGLVTRKDKLTVKCVNNTTSENVSASIQTELIANKTIPQTFTNKTMILCEDANHYVYITKAGQDLFVTQKGYTFNGQSFELEDNVSVYNMVNVSVSPNVGTKTITDNGTYNASSDSLDGYSQVVVNVAGGGSPDELSSTEPKMKHFTERGSTYVINSDGSMDWTWGMSSTIGNSFSGQVPLKNAKKIVIEIDEYGENYQHYSHVDTRNFNTAIGVTDIPVDDYINLDNLQTNNHIVTDIEFNGNTYYGETNIHREIDLTSYIGQDLYLFLQLPGVTLTGLKVTVLYNKFGVYEYHWSNDGKICVRKEIGCTKWIFNGLTKESGDIPVPEELVPYLPDFEAPGQYMHAIAFTEPDGTWDGYHYIGFVYPGTANVKIRSWYSSELGGGTFWGVLDITHYPFIGQQNEYIDPMDVEIYDETLLDKTIISNGTYRAKDEGYSGYSEITVATPVPKADIGYNRIFKDSLTDIYFDANNGKICSYWNKSSPTGITVGNTIQGRTDLNGTISALHITGNITDSWAYYNSSTLERMQFVVGFTDRLWDQTILVGYNDQGSVYIKEEVELTNVQSTSVDIFINLKDTQYQQYASTPKYLFISLFGIEGEFKVDLIPDGAEIHVPYSSICDCYSLGDMKAAIGEQTLISKWTGGTNVGCSWNGTVDLVSAGYKKLHYKLYIGERSYDAQYNQNVRPVIVGVAPTQYQSMQYISPSAAASVYTDYNMYLTSDYKDVYVEGVIDFSAETDPQYLLIVATGHDCEMLDMWFE